MNRQHTRWTVLCAASVALTVAAACSFNDLLKVENPAEIPVNQLDDPKLLNVRLNGVVDAFGNAYTEPVIEYTNFLTDEMITGLNWEDYARANQRLASYLEGPTDAIFGDLSSAHRTALVLAEHIRGWDAADTVIDYRPSLAKTLVFAGYSALVWAENSCQTVISPDPDNPSSTILSQLETFQVALPYLTEGLSLAQASGQANTANLALVGLARANLGLGNWADVVTYATQVPGTFKWWIEFVNIPGGRNPLQGITHGGNFTHGIHPSWTGAHPSFDGTGKAFTDDVPDSVQRDPRIQHDFRDRTGHNGLTPLYRLVQGLRYSNYTGHTRADSSASCPRCTKRTAGVPAKDTSNFPWIARFDTDVLLADYLEAQHHYQEALAMQDIVANEATVLAFVNARRAVGNQAPVALSGQALIVELRRQRARDLFMGGFRLGDLRRWTRFDPGNGPFASGSYFPTGQHPNPTWGQYGPWTCFPIPIQEYEGNPNITRPLDPSVPPAL